MKVYFALLISLIVAQGHAQFIIENMPEPRAAVTVATVGDTIFMVGGENYDKADYFDVNNGFVNSVVYGSDGWDNAKVLQNDEYLFFHDLSNVGLTNRDFYKYNIASEIWTDGKHGFPSNLDDKLLLIDNDVYYYEFDHENFTMFNLVTEESVTEASHFSQREFTIVDTEDAIYLVGGEYQDNSRSNKIEIYDKASGVWSTKETLIARRDPTVVFHENKLLINGGFNDFSNDLEIYDLSTNTSVIVELLSASRDCAIIASGDKCIAAGGSRFDAVVVDLNTFELSEPYELREPIGFGLSRTQGVSFGSRMFIVGTFSDKIHIYNTISNDWEILNFSSERSISTLLEYKNRLYIIGGEDLDNVPSDEILIFDALTSVNEISASDINIYPNPASNVLNLDNEEYEWLYFSIYNQNGQKVKSGKIENQISLSGLKNGIYNIEFSNNKSIRFIKRVVISR